MELVEVKLADIVKGLAANREQQSCRPDARAIAVRARVLDHHLIQPSFHTRAGLVALAVPAIMPLDAARDALEANLAALPFRMFHLGFGREQNRDFSRLDAVENRLSSVLGERLP